METAEDMFNASRYIYIVFICHLSIEKALKGLYEKIVKEISPKTHNLLYLVEKLKIQLPDDFYDFVFTLNRVSVPTRYPDDLQRMFKDYEKENKRNFRERIKIMVLREICLG